MMLPQKIFVDPVENCVCDVEQRQSIVDRAHKRVAPYVVDEAGEKLFYVDSFGWRGKIPGECDACYTELINKLKGE